MAHKVKHGMRMVVVRLGYGRANRGPGVVEKLVLQAYGHVRDRLTVLLGQIRPGGEKGAELALANLVGMVAQLLEK